MTCSSSHLAHKMHTSKTGWKKKCWDSFTLSGYQSEPLTILGAENSAVVYPPSTIYPLSTLTQSLYCIAFCQFDKSYHAVKEKKNIFWDIFIPPSLLFQIVHRLQ